MTAFDREEKDVGTSASEVFDEDLEGEFEPAGLEFAGWDNMEPHPENTCGWTDERTDRMLFVKDEDGDFVISPCGDDEALTLWVKK